VDRGDTGQLVTSAASGDAGAWQLIVERFSGLVWSVVRAYRLGSADAADVFQTTWLRLAEHIGRIEQPDRVGAWLATAARRECLQCLRSAGRLVPTDDASRLEGPPVLDNPTEAAILRAEQQQEDAARDVALWRGKPAVRALPAAAADLDGVAAAKLRRDRRRARPAGRQHRADPGPVPAGAARTTGGKRYHGQLFALMNIKCSAGACWIAAVLPGAGGGPVTGRLTKATLPGAPNGRRSGNARRA